MASSKIELLGRTRIPAGGNQGKRLQTQLCGFIVDAGVWMKRRYVKCTCALWSIHTVTNNVIFVKHQYNRGTGGSWQNEVAILVSQRDA